MLYEQLTEKVIGCAFRIYNKMGFGYEESVYEKCMLIELAKLGLRVESQVPIEVFYDGQSVGHFRADLLIEGALVVELRSIRAIAPVHEAQLVNYLVATGKEVGLLLNFGESKVEVKRRSRLLNDAALV